jgi:hypothetical protein
VCACMRLATVLPVPYNLHSGLMLLPISQFHEVPWIRCLVLTQVFIGRTLAFGNC